MTEDDSELLLRFAREGSGEAFGEVVRRHIDFVYQTALREVRGDAHSASDVTQGVFLQLARKARTVCSSTARSLADKEERWKRLHVEIF